MKAALVVIALAAGCKQAAGVTPTCKSKVARWSEAIAKIEDEYLQRLEVMRWTDCERTLDDLVALQPAAAYYVEAMRAVRADMRADGCLFTEDERYAAIDVRIAAMKAAADGATQRCHGMPGWDAALDTAIQPF